MTGCDTGRTGGQDSPRRDADAAPAAPDEQRVISSRDLLAGRSSIRILHDGEAYSLRLTRNNRLILTK